MSTHDQLPFPAEPDAAAGRFLLLACQAGAEQALTDRVSALAADRPHSGPVATGSCRGWRRAAWRRGVVTFRLPEAAPGDDVPEDVFSALVFARACIHSLGQITGDTLATRVERVVGRTGPGPWDDVHVWHRVDGVDAASQEIRAALRQACSLPGGDPRAPDGGNAVAEGAAVAGDAPGARILDCVIDEADRWWVGWHRVGVPPSGWPGGIYPRPLPPEAVSRAWLKLDEALAVFMLAPAAGERAIELGSAPGGACQRLLEAGLDVVGIDPAAMDPRVAGHPRCTHWRMRARDVKQRMFRGCDWLVTDMNIDPRSTLEALGRIVTTPGVRPRGIVATLKIPDWSRAAELPDWLAAFRGWGYEPRARQLSSGGREVCVAAIPAGR